MFGAFILSLSSLIALGLVVDGVRFPIEATPVNFILSLLAHVPFPHLPRDNDTKKCTAKML